MLARDIEMFIEHCGLKGLSTKTINSYEQTLRLFMQYMDEQGILLTEKITHLAIQGYIKSIKERGKYTVTTNPNSGNYPDRRVDFGKRVSDVTINNYLRNLRVFFNWCVEEELILRSPVKKGDFVKVERRPLEFVSDEDFKRLLKSMNSASFSEYRDSIIIQLLLDTGIRVNECLLIEVTDLDMAKRCISLPADKDFLRITKENDWILLSATPGDCWTDYIPVFIANGFYRNRTQFNNEHVVYSRFSKYPKIDRYLNTGRLIRLRERILVDMDFERKTIPHHENIYVEFDQRKYKDICMSRWNPWEERPIETASEFCSSLRRVVNADESRQQEVLDICMTHPRVIIFYNFDYELDILLHLPYDNGVEVAQWNGHKHQPIPDTDRWVYLVQYNAGAEGWNCIKTDTIIFYSQNYSYKVMEQASGRIDRLNTPYTDLYFYHLKSRSGIDVAISRALMQKKQFNERKFYGA